MRKDAAKRACACAQMSVDSLGDGDQARTELGVAEVFNRALRKRIRWERQ